MIPIAKSAWSSSPTRIEPIDDIAWRIFNYPIPGLVEEQTGPSNLPH